ncbi:hypothetical protein HPP92_020864 [Vanilla planifolia]|uniref:Uncharacterized protein n=1 Tax=Vanilla planifolia TaxID=51239 RepID=A0A835Q0H0_VANPL|nr:hypothetical protein HPP92_020864 [Vanilla planifolia]
MAADISSFNETVGFDDYNPHPYKGGYDIALTYGEPLPHSAAICYPVSGDSSLRPSSPETPLSLIPEEKPVANEPAPVPNEAGEIPTLFGPEDDPPDSKVGYFNGYGEWLYGVEDWWSFSGFYPFVNLETEVGVGGGKYDAEDLRCWSKWKRAADYLFGYSQGYGERRIGIDRDGIPIYANKTLSSSAVDFHIEPVRTETLGYYTDSPDSGSSYFTYKELENYNFSNAAHSYKHHFEPPLQAEVDPFELLFSWQSNYPQPCDEQVHSDTKWFPLSFGESADEVHLPTDNELAYNAHCFEDALQVQLVEAENLHQKVRCYDASLEFFYSDPNWEPTYYMHGEERNHFSFTKHDCDGRDYWEPNPIEVESHWSTCSHHLGCHGISEGEVYNGSTTISNYSESFNEFTSPTTTWIDLPFGEWDNEEPFKPTWMQNPNYYEAYEEISSHWKQDDGSYDEW